MMQRIVLAGLLYTFLAASVGAQSAAPTQRIRGDVIALDGSTSE
jgi:hypothetical protein